MHRFAVAALLLSVFSTHAFSSASIYCGDDQGKFTCVAALHFPQPTDAANQAAEFCTRSGLHNCHPLPGAPPLVTCRSIYAPPGNWPSIYADGNTSQQASIVAKDACATRLKIAPSCEHVLTVCEASDNAADNVAGPALVTIRQTQLLSNPPPQPPKPQITPIPQTSIPQTTQPPQLIQVIQSTNSLAAALTGFLIAILFAVALIFRHPISNFVIHGNLPHSLPVYADHIQAIFKRTQRTNWYGRVIFGVAVKLVMTEQQLGDVRKYWLGRVIAFDSLRRQRQNELARMHMEIAAKAKSEAHDKKNFWSRRWATLRSFFKKLFWAFSALFNLVFALFFIRVNIAKLVRGTVVESKDLTLTLLAKQAIEETADYLSEYLETANTFDGRSELHNAR